jgi:hypothetical protein
MDARIRECDGGPLLRTIISSSPDRLGGTRLYAILMACVLLSLFLFALTEVPSFHPDGHSYIESAILWPHGVIGFLASWIGSRHLAIWIYHLAFAAFGLNLDAIAIALAVLKLLTALSLIVVTACLIKNKLLKIAISILTAFLVFFSPMMNYPATDNIAMTFLAMIWAVWIVGLRSKHKKIFIGIFFFLSGIAYSIRMEILVFSLILSTIYIFRERPRMSLPTLVLCCISLGLGVLLPMLLWNTWVPKPKPASYDGAIALYRPISDYGVGTNGPASARLADILGIDVDEPIASSLYWQAVHKTYLELGPAESNKLITAVGLEAIRTHALALALSGLGDAWVTVNAPGSFKLAPADRAHEIAALSTQLSEYDAFKLADKQIFGAAVYPVATLTEAGMTSIAWIVDVLPRIRLTTQLPGSILLLSIAVSVLAAIRQRDPLWLGAPISGVVGAVLAGISQGPGIRYLEPALMLNFVSMAAAVASVLPGRRAFLNTVMSTAVSVRTSWPAILVTLSLCLFAGTGFWHQMTHGLQADDDTLWLYFASHKIAHPGEGSDLENAVIAAAGARDASTESIARLEQRRDDWLNFVAPAFVWNWLQAVVAPPTATMDYPTRLGRSIPLMFAFAVGLSWLVLIGTLVFLRDWRFLIAAALTVGMLALLSLLPQRAPPQVSMGLHWLSPYPELSANNPEQRFSIFGYMPGNYFAVLVVALFAVRWSGVEARWVYLFLLPLFAVHASLALLLLVHIVAVDLVRRRTMLRDWIVIPLIAIELSYGLWCERLWPTVAGSVFALAALAGVFALLLAAISAKDPLCWLRRLWPAAAQFLDRAGTWLSRQSSWGGDLLLLVLFWVASYPPVWLISQLTGDPQSFAVWQHLEGSAIGLLLAVLCFGAALYVVTRLPTYRWSLIVAAVALVWSLGFVYESRAQPPFWERFAAEVRELKAALSGRKKVETPRGFVFNEAVVYYALGQTLSISNDRLDDLLETAQDPVLTEPVAPAPVEREQRPKRERRADRRAERKGAVATPGAAPRDDTTEN